MATAQGLARPKRVPLTCGIAELPRKIMALRIRWLLIITCSYLLLFSGAGTFFSTKIHAFILLYILSNIELYYIDDELFESSYFYAPLVLLDTFFVTASLMVSGQAGTDLSLVYFLIIILCTVLQDFIGSMVVSTLIAGVYTYLLMNGPEASEPSVYLRPTFLFVASLFYAYFAQVVRAEKNQREEAERHLAISDKLAEAERAKSEFTRNTTHELRTPLTGIMGYSELLLDGGFGPITRGQKEALEHLLESSRGLLGLVDQLLEFSKIEKGETGLVTNRKELEPVLTQLRHELASLEGERPYKVQYEIDPALPRIETDWGKLKNVLKNILANAIKFTDKGEVKLRVRKSSDREVSFIVLDTGIGIPKEQIPVIFEKFRQLDGSQARRYGGTGLGLAITQNLVDLIGGRIEVESEVGQGSTFTVTIPVRPAEAKQLGLIPAQPNMPGHRELSEVVRGRRGAWLGRIPLERVLPDLNCEKNSTADQQNA